MSVPDNRVWLDTIRNTVDSYRQMIDGTIEQLTDQEFFARPAPESNSVAVLLRHLAGNLSSRWTDFLTTDGEKPSRDRDLEFQDWDGDRRSLMAYFAEAWETFCDSLDALDDEDLNTLVRIRGEPHTIPEAVIRSITHVTYHVGQIALVARAVHQEDWNWLTIAPGKSSEFNRQTWGTSASRSVFSRPEDEQSAKDE
ncbi:MAG: DUF1572 family protein [Planctomycetota bacterium]